MVAAVFKISQPGSSDLILKVCSRKGDFLREAYFLSYFAGKIPVPKIIQLIEPEAGLDAAVLMTYVQGDLLKSETVTKALAWEIGSLLARIHIEPTEGYGDLTEPSHLSRDPRISFTMKVVYNGDYSSTMCRRNSGPIQTAEPSFFALKKRRIPLSAFLCERKLPLLILLTFSNTIL